ncbi:MAG: transglutaminase family protein [Synechococcus sp.]|nr:transglutaminase family protein [Synechococcus sp.]
MVRYRVTHSTVYTYSHPVRLESHCVKLCPRTDGIQHLHNFQLTVEPKPQQHTRLLDPDGNVAERLWFSTEPVTTLKLVTMMDVEVVCENPFDYLAAPWAIACPWDYPSALALRLYPYRQLTTPHPLVVEFAQDILHGVNGNAGLFVSQLTQRIYETCNYIHRLEGEPQLPGVTLKLGTGTCRDFAVLWVEACRVAGLAARFVSGYQRGDETTTRHELHAWGEVYMPGGGWRGFDPTLGLAVTDGHIAIASAGDYRHAAPVLGEIYSPQSKPQTTLECDISLAYKQ